MNTRYSKAQNSADKKYNLLEARVKKLENKINNQNKIEAYKGVSFVLLPFILMVGYNGLIEIFEFLKVIKEIKIASIGIILLFLIKVYLTFYRRIK